MTQPIPARFTLTYRVAGNPASSVTLDYGRVLIGRASDCQIIIEDPQASRHHAALELKADGITLTDLDSHNGTFVGGIRIPPQTLVLLASGQPFYIGAVAFSVLDQSAPPARASAATAANPISAPRSGINIGWILLVLLAILACLLAAGGGILIFWGSQAQEALPPGHVLLPVLPGWLHFSLAAV